MDDKDIDYSTWRIEDLPPHVRKMYDDDLANGQRFEKAERMKRTRIRLNSLGLYDEAFNELILDIVKSSAETTRKDEPKPRPTTEF